MCVIVSKTRIFKFPTVTIPQYFNSIHLFPAIRVKLNKYELIESQIYGTCTFRT